MNRGKFLKRYKRFFADIDVNGTTVVAHVPNTGSMKTCLFAGATCLYQPSDDPNRKLKATLFAIETPTGWVGVNTSITNQLVHHAWEHGRIKHWNKLKAAKREYKISKETRLDMVLAPTSEHLEKKQNLHYVEVKNVTFADAGVAAFPDAVTERGQKHLRALTELAKQGAHAEIVYVVQRQNCTAFRPADEIDAEYGQLLREASRAGVIITALSCDLDESGKIEISGATLPIQL
jgi:sugar fermentation stimulation protein A